MHMFKRLFIFLISFGGLSAAVAALPSSVAVSISSMQSDLLALADLMWAPILAICLVPVFLFFKRFAKKI